jgi:hypothetical protein
MGNRFGTRRIVSGCSEQDLELCTMLKGGAMVVKDVEKD